MTGKKEKTRPKPSKPITRRLDAKALREALESVDKEILSKALAGRSIESLIQGAEQLFDVSVADQYYDEDNYIRDFNRIRFHDKYTLRWCVDNNKILLYSHPEECPALIELRFFIPSEAYYLFAIRAARLTQGDYKAKYSFDIKDSEGKIIEGPLNMDNRPNWAFDPPVPVLVYLDPKKYKPNRRLWVTGDQIAFSSISVWKF